MVERNNSELQYKIDSNLSYSRGNNALRRFSIETTDCRTYLQKGILSIHHLFSVLNFCLRLWGSMVAEDTGLVDSEDEFWVHWDNCVGTSHSQDSNFHINKNRISVKIRLNTMHEAFQRSLVLSSQCDFATLLILFCTHKLMLNNKYLSLI